MPLYDYHCVQCKKNYEEIRAFSAREGGECSHCGQESLQLKIVRFRIGKQGDLRESSEFHGCHTAAADHHHNHAPVPESSHRHGPGCGHGSPSSTESSGGESPA